jgi:CubicO group peptidase (beta-lactamase class C family)
MRRSLVAVPLCLAGLTCVLLSSSAAAQREAVRLHLGRLLEGEMAQGEMQPYYVSLTAGQFLFAVVEQRGIDLKVQVFDPNERMLEEFDSPNGMWGPEFISVFTERSGDFRLELSPLNEETDPGEYTIVVERVERAARSPEGQVDQLFAPWDRRGSPGAAIAIIRDGMVVHQKGYGYAQLEYDIEIESSTVFHVASVSKQFTAFAIAMLADQGSLALDDDIRKYLPEVPDFGPTITIRHLIHHTSGLRDQWNLLALAGWRLDDVITRDQVLRLVERQEELNFAPGSRYLYCNTGYTLLAEIVSRVTGESFPEWTARNIFEPLGMTNTHFHDDHEHIVPNRAYSYQSDRSGGFRKAVLSYANVGATSLFTTVEDMVKWLENFDQARVGGPAVIQQMHERGVLNNRDTLGYAFGLGIGNLQGLRTVGHGGADAGFRSDVIRFPDEQFAVVILSNLGAFDPGGMSRRIAGLYLRDKMDFAGPDEPVAPEADPEFAVDRAILQQYVGEYELAVLGLFVTISLDGEHLLAQATGQPTVRLVPESETRFLIREVPGWLTFHRSDEDDVTHFVLEQGGGEFEGTRIEPFSLDEDGLAEYSGRYYSAELETAYTLVVRNGTLVATHVRHDPIELEPEQLDTFGSETWFFGQVRFERNDSGDISGMRVSSGRVRNLLFERMNDR